MKKTEPTTNNVDSQALLKQVALTDLLGGWKDGSILTIGTLGYDPLKFNINHHKEYFALETEGEQDEGEGEHIPVDDGYNENCYNTEHEELNPLMHNTFEHNFEDVVSANASKEIVLAPLTVISDHEIIESNNAESTDEKKKKGERITLADLFLADSDVKMKLEYPAKVLLESSEKKSLKAKHGLSFAKKLIPRVKAHPHPMRDIKKVSGVVPHAFA